MNDLMEQLQDPFASSEVEWRVQNAGISYAGKPYAMVIPYITSRAVQDRLDKIFGVMGWANEFKAGADGGVLCGLTVRYHGNTVTKWDGAENTNIEAVKGGISDSMKRAAVQLGIGRYLYTLPTYFAICFEDNRKGQHKQKFQKKENGKPVGDPIWGSWDAPMLPDFALPHQVLEMRLKTHLEQIKATESEDQLKSVFATVYRWAKDDVQDIDFVKRVEAVYKRQKNDLKIQQTKRQSNET